MTFGEKIKAARKSTGLTQRELAGTFITRNMLSKIEHNTVTPSLQTLLYLAGRLHLPVGDLFSEGDFKVSESDFREKEIRRLFLEGKTDECLLMCEKYAESATDEINLIRTTAYLRRGEECYRGDRIDAAYNDLKASLYYSARTAYISADAIRHARILIDEIERIAPNPDGLGAIQGKYDGFCPFHHTYEQLCVERMIEKAISKRHLAAAGKMINDWLPAGGIYERKLHALLEAEVGDLSGAIAHLRDMAEDDTVCGAERFIIWGHLEQLYAEALEYDEAYACTRIRAELLVYLHEAKQ